MGKSIMIFCNLLHDNFNNWMLVETELKFNSWMQFETELKCNSLMQVETELKFNSWMHVETQLKFNYWMQVEIRLKFNSWMQVETQLRLLVLSSQVINFKQPNLELTQESLRMVTARVLDVLNGSFTSQIETGPTLAWFSDSRGIHSPQCWEPDCYITTAGTGDRTRAAGTAGGWGNHHTTRAL